MCPSKTHYLKAARTITFAIITWHLFAYREAKTWNTHSWNSTWNFDVFSTCIMGCSHTVPGAVVTPPNSIPVYALASPPFGPFPLCFGFLCYWLSHLCHSLYLHPLQMFLLSSPKSRNTAQLEHLHSIGSWSLFIRHLELNIDNLKER